MSRHAAPWSLWAIYRDRNALDGEPGKHARNVSPTHIPAWPFNKKATR